MYNKNKTTTTKQETKKNFLTTTLLISVAAAKTMPRKIKTKRINHKHISNPLSKMFKYGAVSGKINPDFKSLAIAPIEFPHVAISPSDRHVNTKLQLRNGIYLFIDVIQLI